MGRLPPHHIRRPWLTAECDGAAVVVVEAAPGYGKTVLGTELADMWRSVAIEVVLHEGGMPDVRAGWMKPPGLGRVAETNISPTPGREGNVK